jgi:hypothetical protein
MVLGLLMGCVGVWFPAVAQAQSTGPTSIYIHVVDPPQSVTPESGGVPGLSLRATFSLLDAGGAIARTEIERVGLRLGTDSYTGKFTKLETAWSVVLLMDASGTLGSARATNDFRSLRDNLIRSLGGAPASASFALIPFNDRAPTTQEFTRDRDLLGRAVRAVQAQANRPACLNDGLYEAINKLSDAPGRRAVFVVTASADNCATRSIDTVVDFARQNGVQVYAVGVEGFTITQRELEAMTQPTGGLATIRTVSDQTFALDNLMAVLGNQWQAVWVLYPNQGRQTAEFSVTLPDASVVVGDLSFDSDRDYARPPSIAIAGTAQPTPTGVRFNLDIVNPERIATLDVNVISRDTGRSVYQESLTEWSDSILIPSADLVKGNEYSLVIATLDKQGQALAQTEPHDFRYEPIEASLSITSVEPATLEAPHLVITITAQNLEGVVTYRVWLEDESSGTGTAVVEATFAAGEALRLPADELQTGTYAVRVQALGASGQVLAETEPLRVAHERPGALARFIFWLRASTWAVAGLGVCGALSIMGLMFIVGYLVPKRSPQVRAVELALPEKGRRAPVLSPEPPAAPAERPVSAQPEAPRPAPVKAEPRPEAARPAQTPQAATVVAKRSEFLAVLAIQEPNTVAFKAEIRKTPFSLGRHADSDGVLPMDGSSGVSSRHCVITYVNGLWLVQDDKSTYGTTVNGRAIPKGRPTKLEDGAVLGLGPNVKIRFRIVT